MGTCELDARFSPKVRRTLDLSQAQAVVLLAFNDSEVLSYEELQQKTGLQLKDKPEEDVLKQQVLGLLYLEHKIL